LRAKRSNLLGKLLSRGTRDFTPRNDKQRLLATEPLLKFRPI
jgi:hypothetical protein